MPTHRRVREAAARLALSAATFTVLFAVAEVVTRLVYHPENLGTVIQFDPLVGWRLEPDSDLRSVDFQRHIDYRIHINTFGLRDREVAVARTPGRKRILIIGDSIVFGTGVEAQWRFSDFLGRALGGAEVINAGVPGWGNDQELLFFEKRCRPLEPDVVILTLTMANDIVNNMLDHLYLQSARKPRFVLDGDSLRLVDTGFEAPAAYRPPLVRRVLKKSRLALFVKRRIDSMREIGAEHRSVVEVSQGFYKENLERNYSNWSVYRNEYVPDFEAAFRVTEAILLRFDRACREIGAELLVFPFPLRVEVDDEWRAQVLERAEIDPSLLDMSKPYVRLSQFCQAHGIAYFYPLLEFKTGLHKRYLYLDHDNHPNPFGHALAARLLLDELERRYDLRYHIPEADVPYFAVVQ